MAFKLAEEEFYKVSDAMLQIELVARLHDQMSPEGDREKARLCAFLSAMGESLRCVVDAVRERDRLALEERREQAAREADAAIADGRLPTAYRAIAINIGSGRIELLRAWLNREHVIGLVPLPPIDELAHA